MTDHRMKQFRGDEVERLYYKISDVAKLLKVEQSTVRYYEDLFSLPIKRKPNGVRFYTYEQVSYLQVLSWLAVRFKLDYLQVLHKSHKIAETLEAVEKLEK